MQRYTLVLFGGQFAITCGLSLDLRGNDTKLHKGQDQIMEGSEMLDILAQSGKAVKPRHL
ncbi:MAG: hypothetical protein ABIR33_05635 [Pyrinomonadaceae bacterium]